MTIEIDTKIGVDRGVDQAKTVPLAGLDSDLGPRTTSRCILSCAVDQDVVTEWRTLTDLCVDESTFSRLEGCDVIPISHRQDSEIFIVVRSGWSVDLDCSDDAITVLVRKVAVVPAGAVFSGLEFVRLHVTGSEGAFGDTIGTVLDVLVKHADTVPVDRCAVMLEQVADSDANGVTPVRNDCWTRSAT